MLHGFHFILYNEKEIWVRSVAIFFIYKYIQYLSYSKSLMSSKHEKNCITDR